jgi:hypothetical protein
VVIQRGRHVQRQPHSVGAIRPEECVGPGRVLKAVPSPPRATSCSVARSSSSSASSSPSSSSSAAALFHTACLRVALTLASLAELRAWRQTDRARCGPMPVNQHGDILPTCLRAEGEARRPSSRRGRGLPRDAFRTTGVPASPACHVRPRVRLDQPTPSRGARRFSAAVSSAVPFVGDRRQTCESLGAAAVAVVLLHCLRVIDGSLIHSRESLIRRKAAAVLSDRDTDRCNEVDGGWATSVMCRMARFDLRRGNFAHRRTRIESEGWWIPHGIESFVCRIAAVAE